MKVAIVSLLEGYSWGGSEALWSEMAEYALSQGHQVFISYKRWGKLDQTIKALESKGAIIDLRRNNLFTRITRNVLFRFGISTTFGRILGFRPDIVVFSEGSAYDFISNNYQTDRARKFTIPYFFIVQHAYETKALSMDFRLRAINTYCKAKRVFFVSKRNQLVIERQLALHFNNALVVRNPIRNNIPGCFSYPELKDQTIRLACVGRLACHVKGQDLIIEVLGGEKWKNRNWELNLYGEGEDLEFLQKLVSHYELESKVHFLGFVEPATIWRFNHMLIMPSLSEGTSLALLEAMSYGRPIIVTDVGGQAEWVQDSINGFVAKAPTSELLNESLERAWSMVDQWKKFGEINFQTIQNIYKEKAGSYLFQKICDSLRTSDSA